MLITRVTDPDLDPILADIRDRGVTHLSLRHRLILIKRIKESIYRRLKENPSLWSVDGHDNLIIAKDIFNEEDIAFATILSTIKYSDNYRDYFMRNARALGKTMADAYSIPKFEKLWQLWDEPRRIETLQIVVNGQAELFRHEGFAPHAPKVITRDLRKELAGIFEQSADALSGKSPELKVIISRRSLKEASSSENCSTIWHENVHCLCQQFAAACKSGVLNELNPFFADARLNLMRIEFQTASKSALPLSYAADPEENLAYETGAEFIKSWLQNSGWLARLSARFA